MKNIDDLRQEFYDYMVEKENTEQLVLRITDFTNVMSEGDFRQYVFRTTDIKLSNELE